MIVLSLTGCFAVPSELDLDTAIGRKDPVVDDSGGDDTAPEHTAVPCETPTDADGDLYDGASSGGTDCDDTTPSVTLCTDTGGDTGVEDCVATGVEACNGVDDDCDGLIDDPWVASGAGSTVVAGALLDDGAVAVVVGLPSEKSSEDGAVEVYDTAGTLIVRIEGTGHTFSFGAALATGQDLTGDGDVDLVIAAPYDYVDDVANRGRVWVLPGPIDEGTTLDDADWVLDGGALDGQLGGQIAVAPDLTGDGEAELLIGYYRHMLLYSNVRDSVATVEGAALSLELNTGGGAWAWSTTPDVDGDGRDELLAGMSTYDGGAGLVCTMHASALSGARTTCDNTRSDAALPGLGASFARLGDEVWTLSGTTPVNLSTGATLSVAATGLVAGDQLYFSDGTQVFTVDGARTQTGHTVVSDNDLGAVGDIDGDGTVDLRVVADGAAGVLTGITAFNTSCNADGDPVSSAAGDCDDADASSYPGAFESCDGRDNDCDGTVDVGVRYGVALDIVSLADLGDIDADGRSDALVLQADGVWATLSDSEIRASFDFATEVAPAGDADADGVPDLWLFGEHAYLVSGDADGVEDLLDSVLVYDGLVLQLNGGGGRFGDIDGDGVDEVWVHTRDNLGSPWLALWSGAPTDGGTLDEADMRIGLPSGWSDTAVGTPAVGHQNDITGDGLADVVVASASSYYGFGRANVLEGPMGPSVTVDDDSLLAVYGDPGEALGSFVSLPGDVDGDGYDDAWIGAANGARRMLGGVCPSFDSRIAGVVTSVVAVDADADGAVEVWHSDGATVFADGVAVASGAGVFTTADHDGDGAAEAWWQDGALWHEAPGCVD